MSALPYHKRYHSDALAGMMPLTLEERGAYNTLLDLIYDRGGPLIDNERLLAGYMNCSIRKWRMIRDELIAKRKISINRDGLITNGRAEKEIENQSKTHRKLIEAGSKGGRTRAENEKKDNENNESGQATLEAGLSDPQAIPEARSQNSSVPNGTGAEAPPVDLVKLMFDDGVALLTAAGVPDRNARSLLGKWRGQVGDDEVRLALAEARAAPGGISDPVAWFTARFKAKAKPQPGDPDAAFRRRAIEEINRRKEWEARQQPQAAAGGA